MLTPGRSWPDFRFGPELSCQKVQYFEAGPHKRTADGNINSADPAYNPNIMPRTPYTSLGSPTLLRLDDLPTPWLNTPHETDIPFEIKVHYRFMKPGHLMVMLNRPRTVIIDPAYATHANPVGSLNFCGDTTVEVHASDHLRGAWTDIIGAVSDASGLGYRLLNPPARSNWKWACFAECALLSERLDHTPDPKWEWIRECIVTGGWWFTVYLVETHPVGPDGSFISNGV